VVDGRENESVTPIPPRLRPLLDADSPVQQLAGRLVAAGHQCYLVGGSVRDALLDLGPDEKRDVDVATDARPDEVERLVRGWADQVWLQGQRFGTVGCMKDDTRIEITTFRADVYRPESRKPEVAFADDIETDLSRRDFTINAMALRLPEPELVDPFDGAADLAARRLRTPLAPEVSFLDDPLRMLRAARFIAAFELEPDPELVAAVQELHGRLEIVSAERIRDELSKLLLLPDPSAGLWFLCGTGLADEFVPELNALQLEQDPIHQHKDVLAHTIAVVSKTQPDLRVRLAALLHDIGKPKTRSVGPGGVSFHHHEVVGAKMARKRMRALKYSKQMVEDVSQLVYLHLRFHGYADASGPGKWTDSAVRRYVTDAGPLLPRLHKLVRADCTTRNKRRAARLQANYDDLEARIAELAAMEDLQRVRPDLDGNEIMRILDIPAGPQVGEAWRYLKELRLDRGPLDHDEAVAELVKWWNAKG
jgi:poly(A) polymerase